MIDGIIRRGCEHGRAFIGPTRLRLRCDWCRRAVGYLLFNGESELDAGAGYVPQKLGFIGDGRGERGLDQPIMCGEGGCKSGRPVAIACSDACEDKILNHAAFPDNDEYDPAEWGPDFRDADASGPVEPK